jgi:hypothetical protein
MMDVLWIILWVVIYILLGLLSLLLLFVLIIFLLSVIPVKYSAKINTYEKINFYFQAKYFFRLLRFIYVYKDGVGKSVFFVAGIRIVEKKAINKQNKPKKAKSSAEESADFEKTLEEKIAKKIKKPNATSPRNLYAVLTDSQGKTIIKLVLVTIRKILRVFRPKYFNVSGVVGFPDPSNTGMFFGAYEAVAGMFKFRNNVQLWGDFNTDTTIVNIKGKTGGSVSIFRLTLPIAGLLLKKPIRSLIREALRKDD